MRYTLPGVTVHRSGASILPISQLADILKNSTDDEISLDTGSEVTKVKIGTSRYELPTRPVDEFPDLPSFDDAGRYHEITAGILRAMIRRTTFAADKKDSGGRFALKGVLWEAEGEVARLVATDTKRLALCEGKAVCHGPADAGKVSHLVPPKAIALLERNLTDDSEIVRVALRPNDAVFQTERAMIYTTLVQGRYPPYRSIIDAAGKGEIAKIVLPVATFLSCVRQAAVVIDDESKRVDISFSPGRVGMQARGADTGSSEVELKLPDYEGPELAIAFDPSYLVEFLRAVDGEESVTLEMVDGTKPAVFRGGDGYVFLVMPLQG